jgi:hypothetical protein
VFNFSFCFLCARVRKPGLRLDAVVGAKR